MAGRSWALLLLLFLGTGASADVTVPDQYFVANNLNSRCAWASLETLGRLHGYTQMTGLAKSHNFTANRSQLCHVLDQLHVPYRIQDARRITWYYCVQERRVRHCSTSLPDALGYQEQHPDVHIETHCRYALYDLKAVVDEGLGAAIGLRTGGVTGHMVVLLGLDAEEARLLDSNWPVGTVRHMQLVQFLELWDGFALVIEEPLASESTRR